MSARPGFDVPNINVEKRAEEHQEFVDRCVLYKNLRVLFIPNPDKLPTKELVKKFLNEIVIYKNDRDCNPLGWAKPAGSFQGTSNFRAEMSSCFWDFFVETGRKNSMAYNKTHHCMIKVVRDQTLKLSDAENLSLYLRKKIVKYCEKNKTKISEVLVKNGIITLKDLTKNEKKYKSTTMAILLGCMSVSPDKLCQLLLLTDFLLELAQAEGILVVCKSDVRCTHYTTRHFAPLLCNPSWVHVEHCSIFVQQPDA